MLAVTSYAKEYVDRSRASIDAQVDRYSDLATAAAAAGDAPLGAAVGAFEPAFFNGMVLVLDHHFLHRSRNLEGKDGNPLNEVRMLCNSLTENGGIMAADKTIRAKPATTLLKYEVGDEIALSESDFRLLAQGFLGEIESRYP